MYPKIFSTNAKYDLELQYPPGKDMLVSDTLSRSHLSRSKLEFTNSLIHHVHFVLSILPISETRLKQFQLETKNDPILQTLFPDTTQEWPDKHLIPTDLLPYYTHHSDITFCEGILLKKKRIAVPTTLRAETKSLIHQEYLRNESCKKTHKTIIILATNEE